MVTETFKTDKDTLEILQNKELLAAHNGKKSQVIKQALKFYAANHSQIPKTPQVPRAKVKITI